MILKFILFFDLMVKVGYRLNRSVSWCLQAYCCMRCAMSKKNKKTNVPPVVRKINPEKIFWLNGKNRKVVLAVTN